MNEYEAKREARIERYRERAERAQVQGERLAESGRDMLRQIPFGQPIHVGHYSEKADRNYRARACGRVDKGIAEQQRAKYWDRRAESAEKNKAISSDDPDAAEKLQAKIADAEQLQAAMVAANKIVRQTPKNEPTPEKIAAIVALGLRESTAEKCFVADFCGRFGFPGYATQNNGANIKRMKDRLAGLAKRADTETTETEHVGAGCRIVHNADENRVQLIFPAKPPENVRAILKRYGFRWCRTNGAWQRHLNGAGRVSADIVVKQIEALKGAD